MVQAPILLPDLRFLEHSPITQAFQFLGSSSYAGRLHMLFALYEMFSRPCLHAALPV